MLPLPGMLTILVKTIVNNNNNTLAKGIADTNSNTFVAILFTVYYIQQRSFFRGHLLMKLIIVEKMAKSL